MQIMKFMLMCYGIYIYRDCVRCVGENYEISSWMRSLVSLRILVNFAAKSGITLAGIFTSLGSSLVIKVGRKRGSRAIPMWTIVSLSREPFSSSSLSSLWFSIPGHLLSEMLPRARADPYGN